VLQQPCSSKLTRTCTKNVNNVNVNNVVTMVYRYNSSQI